MRRRLVPRSHADHILIPTTVADRKDIRFASYVRRLTDLVFHDQVDPVRRRKRRLLVSDRY
jgi:hypothetical protein